MAPKRKSRNFDERNEIMERQAYASMELALSDHIEEDERPFYAKEELPEAAKEAESASEAAVAEEAPISAEAAEVSEPDAEVFTPVESGKTTNPMEGLPNKTAHDPTSHISEPSSDISNSGVFWAVVFVLLLLAFVVLFTSQ